MSYIIIGIIAFLFFILYDFNSINMNLKWIHSSFFIGCILLATASCGIVISSLEITVPPLSQILIFGTVSLIFFMLLIYTLFFALPFGDTYMQSDKPPKTCHSGVYALCRHPGELWLIGFYLFFWLSLGGFLALTACILFSLFNLFYIIIQDRWSFMKTFSDYNEYKETTPFLIPTKHSIRRCLNTLQFNRR